MDREELLSLLVDQILKRPVGGQPIKVAIDGRCGAGKTILADEVGARLGSLGFQVLRPSVDGFHHPREHRYRQGEYSAKGYYEDAFDYQAVGESLLNPLPEGTILLFEGIFILRRELNMHWDLRILVDIDPAIARSRALARDTGVIGEADVVERKYKVRYDPAWQIYEELEHPASKADIVIDNSEIACPRLRKPLTL